MQRSTPSIAEVAIGRLPGADGVARADVRSAVIAGAWPAELGIALDRVCSIVVRAREFDAQEAVVEEDYGANPIDEGFRSILEAYPGDPTYRELRAVIDGLNVDEQCALVALVWVGRGGYDVGQWKRQAIARSRRTGPTSRYLLGIPVLADYQEEGLAAFGWSCVESLCADCRT